MYALSSQCAGRSVMLYDYAGCIHFHSNHSLDGYIPVSDIIEAAKKNNLDFIMLTDHSSLAAKPMEGWHGNTLLIVGQEISPRFNHYIAFGASHPIFVREDAGSPPQSYIDEVRRQGGIGFISHPDHKGAPMFHVKHYPWLDWTVSGFNGMGIWDFMTDWQSSLAGRAKALISFMFPALVLRGPEKKTLERWDLLARTRKVAGIGETDNHAAPQSLGNIRFRVFSYERIFRYIRTHIVSDGKLSRDGLKDATSILGLLERGRAYIAMEYFRKADGFSFMIGDNDRCAVMGDDFILGNEAVLNVRSAGRGKIRIMKDGALWNEFYGDACERSVREKGVYRVEVFLKRFGMLRPWIFSNPIYVR